MASKSRLPEILKQNETKILNSWIELQNKTAGSRSRLISDADRTAQSQEFMTTVIQAIQGGNATSIEAPEWDAVRAFLNQISSSRAKQGFTPGETATFVFSVKQPIFEILRQEFAKDAQTLAEENWAVTAMIDKLGLHTVESYQKAREELINRQQQELLELSTPVVKLWEGILALPLIGTLDSARTQVVMESLLQKIVETGSALAIIDITGVPTVDTLVAQHLLKTVAAARLMGADCIISGIRPQIAQTIVHLGVDLGEVVTKSSLADAFVLALKKTGQDIRKSGAA